MEGLISFVNVKQMLPLRLIANGKKGPTFNPERAIRQGDPLSPHIFIIGTEYLG